LKSQLSVGAAAVALLTCAPLAAAQPGHSLPEDAKAFGTRELLRQVDISPSGKKVVMLASAAGAATTASVIDVATSKVTRLMVTDGKAVKLYSCSFAGEEHVVCQYGGNDHVGQDLVGFTKMFVINADGTNLRKLGQEQTDRAAGILQDDGAVIDWMTGSEGKLLMQRTYVPEGDTTGHLISRTKSGLGVDLLDTDSGKFSSIEAPKDGAGDYLTDGRGNVRLVTFVDSNSMTGMLSGLSSYKYRLPGRKDWLDLGQFDDLSRQGVRPLAIDADRNALFALQRMNGRDALVQIALDGSKTSTLVAKNDRVDIDGVVRIGRGQRVIGYTFADERRRIVYFDPEFDKLHDSLKAALKASIDFEEASSDGQQLLILASADNKPGSFYIYSRPTRSLLEVGPIRPELDGRPLAAMQPVEVPASDGVIIPAYVTLPPGSSGKGLPAVVLPHGGPSARDEWGFDWLPQFLAARGYAVIQPEFRGSDGYGDAWLNKNGFQNWRTSIGDVTAAAKYLVSKGIADANRMAIMGWSYGGYAALQSAAMEPTLYKAAIAIAPLTDLAMAERDSEGFTNSNLVKRIIGKGPHLVEGSPLEQAARIKVPVLLVHGDMDATVRIHQSEAMLGALRKAGTPVDMLTFKGLDHQLDDTDARIAMLTKAGELLDRTIGH
jgi:dipeptidyl aminopeptidase/acylaminoacyl peptidase